MTPQAALEVQIGRYRAMSREERVGIALRLHELACDMTRLGIRRQYPEASAARVEELLRQRLELARTL
jgi:Rv0078B-related antitoxin